MHFLDLDLDFFLNDNAYCSGSDSRRLDSNYKPWSVIKVRQFLEERCNLSHDMPVPGRTIETHDSVINFWRKLIESGGLIVPFDVIHIDAHPDLTVSGGLYQTPGLLHIDSEHGLTLLESEIIHSGNYLTFAIAFGWIASLLWIPLRRKLDELPKWYGDAKYRLMQLKRSKVGASPKEDLSSAEHNHSVPFKILPWYKFKTKEAFDYIVLSRSPDFTPPESDALIPVVEWYMRKI